MDEYRPDTIIIIKQKLLLEDTHESAIIIVLYLRIKLDQ